MNTDFLDAHRRHLGDAHLLFSASHWANADHLYGVAAECGLKRLMMAFEMPFDAVNDRPSIREDRCHVEGTWIRYETYRAGGPQGPAYGLASGTPFGDWRVDQRYARRDAFDQARVGPHRSAAMDVERLVKKAIAEGLL